jgi:hypothetical protein
MSQKMSLIWEYFEQKDKESEKIKIFAWFFRKLFFDKYIYSVF